MYTLEFEIPALPKTTNANSRVHWRSKHREAKNWDLLINHHATLQGKPKAPLHRAILKLTRYSSSEPDYDGLVSSFKFVIDALVSCGVLVNDKRENVGVPEYKWEKVARNKGGIKVIVEEV